jgi:hypothetical protein
MEIFIPRLNSWSCYICRRHGHPSVVELSGTQNYYIHASCWGDLEHNCPRQWHNAADWCAWCSSSWYIKLGPPLATKLFVLTLVHTDLQSYWSGSSSEQWSSGERFPIHMFRKFNTDLSFKYVQSGKKWKRSLFVISIWWYILPLTLIHITCDLYEYPTGHSFDLRSMHNERTSRSGTSSARMMTAALGAELHYVTLTIVSCRIALRAMPTFTGVSHVIRGSPASVIMRTK